MQRPHFRLLAAERLLAAASSYSQREATMIPRDNHYNRRHGLTLIEIIVATTLMLILMVIVLRVFGLVGGAITESRATLDMMNNVRATCAQLEEDLSCVTATMRPPRDVESGEGYFEYIEGPVGPVLPPSDVAFDSTKPAGSNDDTTVGDFDDVLMFTVRSKGAPFVGRFGSRTIESYEAEVAWFVRGTTLYRRVMLIVPDSELATPGPRPGAAGFYGDYDVSARQDASGDMVANTLADLTKRECRFVHGASGFPHAIRPVTIHTPDGGTLLQPWLPTLEEASDGGMVAGDTFPRIADAAISAYPGDSTIFTFPPTGKQFFDPWNEPNAWFDSGGAWLVNRQTGALADYPGTRVAEDVILTNVIGFDVKAWDPEAPIVEHSGTGVALKPGDAGYSASLSTPLDNGAYVDLGYDDSNISSFSRRELRDVLLTYDTWSTHYESDGIDQDGNGSIDEGTNGFDDDGDGVVDNPSEQEAPPPYDAPLRGIQVKIRVFEPRSMQVREVTVVHDFLP